MPLPSNGQPWPPKQLANISPQLAAFSAWYSGDVAGLETAYRQGSSLTALNRPSQYRGGIVGGLARWFWGAPLADTSGPKAKLHVPIAADLCQASADLLFAEPPTFTVDNTGTQERLDVLADGVHTVLAEGAEIGAALGSEYLRVTWDRELLDRPFLTSVHADAALPEFRWGRLVAVTFWHVVATDGQQVWRHLERHELDSNRIGRVVHGLYVGTGDNLGRAVPLTESPATEPLARLVDADSAISTESPGLAVVHVRNQGPQRRWRNDPLGAHLGRSDLDGVEPLMDALDETYTAWMRDIRLGKVRVFVSRDLLEDQGPGQGASWDPDREIYTPLKTPPGSLNPAASSGGSSSLVQAEQFKIRYEEHRATAAEWRELILQTAGYSAQTFGTDRGPQATDLTATEVQARERRSYLTRDRKIRLQGPAVQEIMTKLLAVDAAIFNSGASVEPVRVEFADSVQDSQITIARTAQTLAAARAASVKTLVELVHPEWDDDQVAAEVDRIHAEDATAPLPDPTTFTGA